MSLSPFIERQVQQNPIEATILRRLVRECRTKGDPIVSVWDGEESTKVSTTESILEIVFNLDVCHLYTRSGGWIFWVGGNEWDVISDYTLSLEDTISETNHYVDTYN